MWLRILIKTYKDVRAFVREELHDFVASQGAKILTMQVKEPGLEERFLKLLE